MTIALFYLLLLYGVVVFRHNVLHVGNANTFAPFDLPHTIPLRGLLALFVVAGHLDNVVGSQTKVLLPFHMATPAVAVFFFLSGYGLLKSFQKKGEKYLDGFVAKSAVKLLIPLFITTILYQFVLFAIGRFDWNLITSNLKDGVMPLIHSWYVYALFVFYILFYLVYRFADKKSTRILIIASTILLFYITMRYVIKWDFQWWLTCFAFPTGIVWADQENKIHSFLRKNFSLCGIVLVIICILLIVLNYLIPRGVVFCTELPYVALGPLIALLLNVMPLPTHNKLLNFLGGISFEIYLFHGFFEETLKDVFVSPYVYIILVFVLTIGVSWVFHSLYEKINRCLLSRISNNR